MTTTIKNQKLFCSKCGGEFSLQYPLGVSELAEKTKAFDELHKDCKQTWTEPKADQTKSIKEKAIWWMGCGERGMSSETMWNFFMGERNFPIHHPYDPGDFKRCYKLLEAVPEWKTELYELKSLSTAWSNLVDNWPELTEMFEENVRTEWKETKRIGMYEFMQTLIR